MKVYSGNLELYKSGVIQTAFSKNIKFDFDAFALEVKFKSDDEDKRHKFYLINDKKDLALDLFNYNTSEAAGFIDPVEIGSLNNRILWFNYRASCVAKNAEGWVMQYFFYLGENIDE